MLKNFLNERNIAFEEINIQENPLEARKLIEATGQMGVPQTEVNGQWVVGFAPNTIMTLLKQ